MYDEKLHLSVCFAVDERLKIIIMRIKKLIKKRLKNMSILNKACTRQLNNEQIPYKAQGSEKEI